MQDQVTARARELLDRCGLGFVPMRVALLLVGVCATLVVVAVVRWQPWRDDGFTIRESAAADAAVEASSEAFSLSSSEPTTVIVHVVGAVRHPGVFELPAGSRAIDAVEAAGGLLPNAGAEGLNLAAPLSDGEQVCVPTLDELASGTGGAAGTGRGAAVLGGGSPAKVDLNSASESELDTLPGVGPSTAAKIVADREQNGPFGSPEDLMRVAGIGAKKFESLKELVTVR